MTPPATRRVVAPLLLSVLLAASCSDPPRPVDDVPVVSPTSPASPAPTAPASSAPATSAPPTTPAETVSAPSSPGPTAPPGTAEPTGTSSDTPGGSAELTPADDAATVGANGRALLRRDRASLVIEVDAQEGVEVDQDALDHLAEVLGQVLDKPDGIVFEGANTFPDSRTTWTADDLREVAAANRVTATTDESVSVHVLYVAGSHAEDGDQTNAIGLAYSASTVALFPHRWQGVVSLLGSGEAIERAVLVHELGHLLSLVNLGYRSEVDHEDPDHPGHSRNKGSAMFHAIESTLIGQAFDGPPPDTFDDADRADLEGLRTGRL